MLTKDYAKLGPVKPSKLMVQEKKKRKIALSFFSEEHKIEFVHILEIKSVPTGKQQKTAVCKRQCESKLGLKTSGI